MIETRETLKPEVFHVKANCFTFNHDGKEVTLPKCGYTPSYKDNLVVYQEERNGLKNTVYSFENKEGKLRAMYTEDTRGDIVVELPKKAKLYVSGEDMNKIKSGKVGVFHESSDANLDFIENNGKLQGAAALLIGGATVNPLIAGVVGCGIKGIELLQKSKNRNPNEVEMNVTSVTHEGEAPKRELTRKEMLDQISRRHGYRR